MTDMDARTAMTDDRHTRYRNGLCADCGQRRYSPGRVRCHQCHQLYVTGQTTSMERGPG